MERCAVIMAGGAGERFWPLSRQHYPKQLLKITGNCSMLSESVERIRPLIPPENIFVITGAALKKAIETEIPELPPENIIAEPEGKNTAACLALACAYAMNRFNGDVLMAVLTADHSIGNADSFLADCNTALTHAEEHDVLVTFGIVPNRPETGYGYIETGALVQSGNDGSEVFSVASFREKPNLETAREFFDRGNFLWNTGMFVWKASVLVAAFEKHLATAAAQIGPMKAAFAASNPAQLAEAFKQMPKISIDYGILERADNVRVVKARFDWDDIGTWSSLGRLMEPDAQGNIAFGNSVNVESENCIIYSTEKSDGKASPRIVVGFGLKDVIVVNTDDAILVFPADKAQQVKDVVTFLREQGRTEYL